MVFISKLEKITPSLTVCRVDALSFSEGIGRYKAILCDRDAYLWELVRYIHLNPARMKHPQDPWKYRWSSHRAYLGEGSPVKIQTDAVLKQFASNQRAARREFLGFMKEGLGQGHVDRFYQTIEQRFLGDERFVDQLEKKKKEPEPPKLKVKFSRLVEGVAALYGIEAERLVGTERKRGWVAPRSLLVYVAREWCGIKASVNGTPQSQRLDGQPIARGLRGGTGQAIRVGAAAFAYQTLDAEKVCRPLMHELAPLAQQITHRSLFLGINVALG